MKKVYAILIVASVLMLACFVRVRTFIVTRDFRVVEVGCGPGDVRAIIGMGDVIVVRAWKWTEGGIHHRRSEQD